MASLYLVLCAQSIRCVGYPYFYVNTQGCDKLIDKHKAYEKVGRGQN